MTARECTRPARPAPESAGLRRGARLLCLLALCATCTRAQRPGTPGETATCPGDAPVAGEARDAPPHPIAEAARNPSEDAATFATGDADDVADAPPPEQTAGLEIGLRLAARRAGTMALHPLVDGTVLIAAGPEVVVAAKDGPLVREPRFLVGLVDPGGVADSWQPAALGGRWPDEVYLVDASLFGAAEAPPLVYRLRPTAWEQLPNEDDPVCWEYAGFAPWVDETLLARRRWRPLHPACCDEEPDRAAELEALRRTPRTFEVIAGRTEQPPPQLGDWKLDAFDAAPSGEVVATSGETILCWKDGQPQPTVHPAPALAPDDLEPHGRGLGVRVVGARAWVFGGRTFSTDDVITGRGYLAACDGEGWRRVTIPFDGEIYNLWESTQGTVWVATTAGLWRARPEADALRWERIAVPVIRFPFARWEAFNPGWGGPVAVRSADDGTDEGVWMPRVQDVVAFADDDVWVLVRQDQHVGDHWTIHAVLHNRDHGSPLTLPNIYALWGQVRSANGLSVEY
ncbi:MAG: hypothetical protein JXB32_02780 [Deltaproteobacteria bacterium]|nr:hypothetical protein [Deltaproteobacteria bacterium]